MEKTEEIASVWECKKCGCTELRVGPGPHFCIKKKEHKSLFTDDIHIALCDGEMEEACLSTDTNVPSADTK